MIPLSTRLFSHWSIPLSRHKHTEPYTEILGAFLNDQSLTRSPLSLRVWGGGRGNISFGEVCSLPEILLLRDIKERVEVEHVEANLVQGLEQEGLGQLQLVKPIGNNYHLVRYRGTYCTPNLK
jgi:hypothetical protein